MSARYRPSTGLESVPFLARWCDRCRHDAAAREGDLADGCQILAATLAFAVDDPDYPEEWTYNDANAPICTAFEPEEDEPQRCWRTLDLFAQEASHE